MLWSKFPYCYRLVGRTSLLPPAGYLSRSCQERGWLCTLPELVFAKRGRATPGVPWLVQRQENYEKSVDEQNGQ